MSRFEIRYVSGKPETIVMRSRNPDMPPEHVAIEPCPEGILIETCVGGGLVATDHHCVTLSLDDAQLFVDHLAGLVRAEREGRGP